LVVTKIKATRGIINQIYFGVNAHYLIHLIIKGEGGLIKQTFEGKNRRTKYLVPTKAADAYFAKMSKAITSAVNA